MRPVDGDTAGFGVVSSVAGNATQDCTLDDTPLRAFGHVRERQLLDRTIGGNGSAALVRLIELRTYRLHRMSIRAERP